MKETSGPVVAPILAGFLLASALLASARRSALDDGLPGLPHPPGERAARGFEDLSARELRGAPGVGQVRAAAIARARWERSGGGRPLRLSDLKGIGPATELRIARWLATRAEGSDGLERPADGDGSP